MKSINIVILIYCCLYFHGLVMMFIFVNRKNSSLLHSSFQFTFYHLDFSSLSYFKMIRKLKTFVIVGLLIYHWNLVYDLIIFFFCACNLQSYYFHNFVYAIFFLRKISYLNLALKFQFHLIFYVYL